MKPRIFLLLAAILLIPQSVYAEVSAPASVPPADNGLLWLINGNNRLPENFVPSGMKKHQGLRMRSEIIAPYAQMLEAMKADGLGGLYVQSAYRDYGHQSHIFSQKKTSYLQQGYDSETAAAYAANTVARPGASEHQMGLALDVTVDGKLDQSFGETDHGRWISENCQRFGFVLRYPQDKTEITQIIYEPWHIRYVGVPHAAFMKEKNLCLEEYMDYLAENKKYIYWLENKSSYYLITAPASDDASGRYGGRVRNITTELKALIF